jgi:sulfoquinovosyltransferase
VFNPKHKSQSMRERMSDGHPDEPLLVYVGRLGAEKNTEALKDILTQVWRWWGCGVGVVWWGGV